MGSFENKVFLITGATSGLGATAAVSLAGKGAKVVITGRREEQGNADALSDGAYAPWVKEMGA